MHSGPPGAAPELEAKLSSAVLGFGSSHRVCAVTDEPRSENNRLGIRGACSINMHDYYHDMECGDGQNRPIQV